MPSYWIDHALDGLYEQGRVSAGITFIGAQPERLQFLESLEAYIDSLRCSLDSSYDSIEASVITAINNARDMLYRNMQALQQGFASGVTLLAGAAQLAASAEMLAATPITYGASTFPGLVMGAHGANNIEEGAMGLYGLITGDTVHGGGELKQLYRQAAVAWGHPSAYGDVAYGLVDLGLSGYGLTRLTLKKGEWRLFRYSVVQFERGYKRMGKTALFFEGGGDFNTIVDIRNKTSKK